MGINLQWDSCLPKSFPTNVHDWFGAVGVRSGLGVVHWFGPFHEVIGCFGKVSIRRFCYLTFFPCLAFFEGPCGAFQLFLALEERGSLSCHGVFLPFIEIWRLDACWPW
jgi:hypothetical protein